MRPFIISITGAHSSSGKTFIAEAVVRRLPGNWGAIKYTRTELYSRLTDEDRIIEEEGKDTGRLKRAGALHVQWIQSPPEELGEILEIALERISGMDGIVVEGNSPAELISPDVLIFVFGDDPDNVKPSARPLIDSADYLLYKERPSIKTAAKMYNKYLDDDIGQMLADLARTFSLYRSKE